MTRKTKILTLITGISVPLLTLPTIVSCSCSGSSSIEWDSQNGSYQYTIQPLEGKYNKQQAQTQYFQDLNKNYKILCEDLIYGKIPESTQIKYHIKTSVTSVNLDNYRCNFSYELKLTVRDEVTITSFSFTNFPLVVKYDETNKKFALGAKYTNIDDLWNDQQWKCIYSKTINGQKSEYDLSYLSKQDKDKENIIKAEIITFSCNSHYLSKISLSE